MSADVEMELKMVFITAALALLVWGHYRRKQVSATIRFRTIAPRLLASLVDSTVLAPVAVLVTVMFASGISGPIAAAAVAVQAIAWIVYTVVMHRRFGQTVGKMATKVRVVDVRTGEGLSWRQALLREGIPMAFSLALLGHQVYLLATEQVAVRDIASGEHLRSGSGSALVFIPMAWLAVEVLTALTNSRRRALHDLIAGTVVVRTNAVPRRESTFLTAMAASP